MLPLLVQLLSVVIRMATLPVLVIMYVVAPEIELSQKLRSPVNKFVSFVASYFIFLILLYTQNELDTRDPSRGPPKSGDPYLGMKECNINTEKEGRKKGGKKERVKDIEIDIEI